MRERIPWIDTLKGIGIVFVTIMHTAPESLFRDYLSAFFMPLFFFASGYVFERQRYPSWGSLLAGRSRALLVPYVFFFALHYVVAMAVAGAKIGVGTMAAMRVEGLAWVPGFLWATPEMLGRSIGYMSLWFLPCMFVTELFFYGLSALAPARNLVLALLVLGLAAAAKAAFLAARWPWGADVALTAAVIYGAGWLAKRTDAFSVLPRGGGATAALLIGLTVATGAASLANGVVTMGGNYFGKSYALFVFAAFAGIVSWALVARRTASARWLRAIGRQSLAYYALNLLMLDLVLYLLTTFVPLQGIAPGSELAYRAANAAISLVETVLILALSAPLVYGIARIAPFLIGRRQGTAAAQG